MATVYAVASAKGGVGKTTTTAAVATLLADSGADVVAIDADLGMANLAESVGVTPGGITLHDVLAGAADPRRGSRRSGRPPRRPRRGGPRGVRGGRPLRAPGGRRRVRRRRLRVCGRRRGALARLHAPPLGLADETLLVSTAERSALGDTEKTRQLLTERLGGSVAGVAITRRPRDRRRRPPGRRRGRGDARRSRPRTDPRGRRGVARGGGGPAASRLRAGRPGDPRIGT